jgi:polyphosphate glucokinase
MDGQPAEKIAAASIKDIEGLTYAEYIPRLQRYYSMLERLFTPDLINVGGGISKEADQFLPHLRLRAPIVPAKLRNQAGIIGAARIAADRA